MHVAQPRAGEEQEAKAGGEQHRGGAEIRLEQQQQRGTKQSRPSGFARPSKDSVQLRAPAHRSSCAT